MPPIAAEEPLIAFLADRDVPCPCCGYNLRGLTSDCCPECRQQVVLTIAMAEPPIMQFVLAIIGLASCGAAFAFGFVCVIVISVFDKGFPQDDEAVVLLWIPISIVLLDLPAVLFMMLPRSRRWFGTRAKTRRWLIVLACWGTSLAVLSGWLVSFFLFF